jgi:hypothetical protein
VKWREWQKIWVPFHVPHFTDFLWAVTCHFQREPSWTVDAKHCYFNLVCNVAHLQFNSYEINHSGLLDFWICPSSGITIIIHHLICHVAGNLSKTIDQLSVYFFLSFYCSAKNNFLLCFPYMYISFLLLLYLKWEFYFILKLLPDTIIFFNFFSRIFLTVHSWKHEVQQTENPLELLDIYGCNIREVLGQDLCCDSDYLFFQSLQANYA